MNIHLGDIGHIIQLAIAPVFLLSGVGTNLIVLTNRLARIIGTGPPASRTFGHIA